MGIFSRISRILKAKSGSNSDSTSTYVDMPTYVHENHATLKKLLCSYGFNDSHKRLCELAEMVECPILLLCSKQRTMGSFLVFDCNDSQYDVKGKSFQWQHAQAAASNNAEQVLLDLPFPKMGASAFISVPVKNSRNMVTGIILGLYTSDISDIDNKTRLLHILAPLFDAELQVEQMRAERQQYETRIASLNQNMEVIQSDLNREKEKSQESSDLKRLFLTNLGQEIRTPMNAVIGFMDLIESTDSEEERRVFIDIVKRNSRLTLNVIDSLVDISKLQSNYLNKSAVPHSLNKLIDDVVATYKKKLEKVGKKINFELNYALSSPNDTIWNSEEIIRKILEQILNCSVEATPDNGVISIHYAFDQKEIKFEVSDSGLPMQPGDEEKIFNLMAIADANLEGKTRIHDIGLTLAKKYIELTHGRIWVDMNYLTGAKVCFSIATDKL